MLDTPVLFLIFKRPDVTEKVFNQIKIIKPAKFFIAADGPRNEEEKQLCDETRALVLDNINWECEVKTLFREKNLGLRPAVTGALDWFFDNVEQGIILEDDCVPSQSFFSFCEELLNFYKTDNRIMHICGNNFQDGVKRGDASYYFSKLMHCWGWASWKRAWKLNRPDFEGFEYFKKTNLIENVFDNENYQKFWLNCFEMVKQGKVSSWAFIWCYSIYVNNGLCIAPNQNLVSNIGFGEDSTHCKETESILANINAYDIREITHPSFIVVTKNADNFTMDNVYLN